MKIVVIGGSGLIGSKLVSRLGEHGHDAVAADLTTGVNTLTGEGLDEALAGAAVVVDVSNAPSLEFFRTSPATSRARDRDEAELFGDRGAAARPRRGDWRVSIDP